ncbi:hypothetical protein D3C81_2207260 [compost metagenome]
MAVHFQRVEILVGVTFERLTAADSPLGFHIQAQQLVAHALQGGFHLAQGELGVIDLLLDTPTDDRGFTS